MNKRFIVVTIVLTLLLSFSVVQADEPGAPERTFSSLLNNCSDFLYEKLEQANGDIDTIVYNGEGNLFNVRFTKDTDNPFGIMGYLLYEITKGLALVIMLSVLLGVFTKVQISAVTKNKVSFFEALNKFALSFVLIFWMPSIMNFCLDLVNTLVLAFNPTSYPGVGLGFMDSLKEAAHSSKTLADAAVYGASVGLSVYFVFVYATRALHLALFLFLFPIIVMYLNSPKMAKQFDEFLSDIISTLSIQPFDALMFLGISLVFSHPSFIALGADAGFWKIVLIMSLIPIRSIARKYLGFTPRSAISDMAGLAGMMGMYNLARGVTGGVTGVAGGVASGFGDLRNAKKYRSSMGFGEDTAGGQGDVGQDGAVPLSSARPLEMPDISTHKANYGIDIDRIGRTASTPQEAYNMLSKRGWSSITSSVGKGALGAVGGAYGGALGLGLGVGGAAYGAAIGGMLGGGAGYTAGKLAGNINPFAYYDTYSNKKSGTATDEASGSNEGADFSNDRVTPIQSLGDGSEAGQTGLVNAQSNQVTNIDVNAGHQSGSRPVGLPGPGTEQYDVHTEFNKHLENMPKEVIEKYKEKANKHADTFMGKRSNLSPSEQESWNNVRDSSFVSQQVDYALGKIKGQGYNIDTSAIESMSRNAKSQIRETILKEMQKHSKSPDVDLEDII